MKNSDKPINPTTSWNGCEDVTHLGLTKREYFAGLAMQGMIANQAIVRPKESDLEFRFFSERAVKYADELLKQLEE